MVALSAAVPDKKLNSVAAHSDFTLLGFYIAILSYNIYFFYGIMSAGYYTGFAEKKRTLNHFTILALWYNVRKES